MSADDEQPLVPGTKARVRVPATSANLGSGFDALGLALALHDDVEIEVLADPEQLAVEITGEGSETLPRDASHLVVAAVHAVLRDLDVPLPGLAVRCVNTIPQGSGLGSSAAAAVAGVVAGRALLGLHPYGPDALRLAVELEGHPDNAVACLHGGLALTWPEERGSATVPRVVSLPLASDVQAVVCVPDTTQSTQKARSMLPDDVPHLVASRQAGRAALLVHALSRAPQLLLPATEDLLHQPFRAQGQPGSAALVKRLRAVGLAACSSGAGPAVLVLSEEDVRGRVASVVQNHEDEEADASGGQPPVWRVRALQVDEVGAKVDLSG